MKDVRIIICMLFMLAGMHLSAQKVALKTNLLYDATATVNLGTEIGLAPQWSLDLSANYNGWTFSDNKKWKHWLAQPEARYWFCQRFNGHFLGLHLMGGQYNWGGIKMPFGLWKNLENYRYEGWYAGGGISYGYQWLLSNRWSMEASVGVGYVRAHYDQYECVHCGEWQGQSNKNYLGVTKAAISLIYVIK